MFVDECAGALTSSCSLFDLAGYGTRNPTQLYAWELTKRHSGKFVHQIQSNVLGEIPQLKAMLLGKAPLDQHAAGR